jgi:uncharacterized sulfatase
MSLRLLSILAALALIAPARAADDRPPNVLLIISDDHAWTDYGFMDHPEIKTPRLDRLAAGSLRFRRGYVPSSLCSPSLATILTGLYPHQHKITSNDPPPPPAGSPARKKAARRQPGARAELIDLFDRVPTLPRLLGSAGYESFQTGKWWGGDYRHGGFTGGMSHGDVTKGGRHGDAGLDIGRKTMQPALDFIDKANAAGKPFLLWYAPMLPHSPHNPPERLLAKYRDRTPSIEVAKYWACVEWFDETCGQLLDHLDARGIADDTLVVYVADNGWIQDPTADRYAPRSKQSPYDGGLRTPILLRWPGKVAPADAPELASSIDLAPTILAAAGVKPTAEMPGINLRDADARARRDAIFGACFTHDAVDLARPESSLRFRWTVAGPYKLIVPARPNEPDAPVELFDITDDPHETRNLAATHPEVVRRLADRLDRWWPAAPAADPQPAPGAPPR